MNEYTTHQTGALLKNGEPMTMAEVIEALETLDKVHALGAAFLEAEGRDEITAALRYLLEYMFEHIDTTNRDHTQGDA